MGKDMGNSCTTKVHSCQEKVGDPLFILGTIRGQVARATEVKIGGSAQGSHYSPTGIEMFKCFWVEHSEKGHHVRQWGKQ